MDNSKKIPADMHAFMRELIQEVLDEQQLMNEWIDMDIEMFAKWGHISDAMFKAELGGKLESFYKNLQDKLSGPAQEAADYFYSFIQSNRDSLDESLWANIRAKQARGEEPAHPNSKAYKSAVKAAKRINAKDEVLAEGATCCGRCGRVHKLKKDGGEGCKKPYIAKSSPKHCMNS